MHALRCSKTTRLRVSHPSISSTTAVFPTCPAIPNILFSRIRNTMASSGAIVKSTARQVKPLLSLDKLEARRRVLNLYKAWYRQIPYVVMDYDIPKTVPVCRKRLREEFEKHRQIQDIRVIDMLVIKGQMELKETVEIWKQKSHIMSYFKETIEPKPQGFLSKFLAGHE